MFLAPIVPIFLFRIGVFLCCLWVTPTAKKNSCMLWTHLTIKADSDSDSDIVYSQCHTKCLQAHRCWHHWQHDLISLSFHFHLKKKFTLQSKILRTEGCQFCFGVDELKQLLLICKCNSALQAICVVYYLKYQMQWQRDKTKLKKGWNCLPFCWRAWCCLWGSGGCLHPHRWTCDCRDCYGPGDRTHRFHHIERDECLH